MGKKARKPRKKEKRRRLENLKDKFRKSQEWKDFRAKMASLHDHTDYITQKRLSKGFNVHHLRSGLSESEYCDISHEDEFIPLNSYSHKLLHYLFKYYQKDKEIVNRLVEVMDRMCELSLADDAAKPTEISMVEQQEFDFADKER